MSESNLKKVNEKIAEGVTEGFQKIEDGVVGGYKKIENGVVGGYKKIEDGVVEGFSRMTDKFVDKFLTHEGESVEDAKKRLESEQAAREAAGKAAVEKHAVPGTGSDVGRASIEASREMARASIEASKNAGKH